MVTKSVCQVKDISEEQVISRQIQNTDRASVELNEVPGFYLLTIKTDEGQKTLHLVVN